MRVSISLVVEPIVRKASMLQPRAPLGCCPSCAHVLLAIGMGTCTWSAYHHQLTCEVDHNGGAESLGCRFDGRRSNSCFLSLAVDQPAVADWLIRLSLNLKGKGSTEPKLKLWRHSKNMNQRPWGTCSTVSVDSSSSTHSVLRRLHVIV